MRVSTTTPSRNIHLSIHRFASSLEQAVTHPTAMQHPKISRKLLIEKINGTFKFDGKTVAIVAGAHAAVIFLIMAIPGIRNAHPLLPFIPVFIIIPFIIYKTKGIASGFISCPECKKPLGIMEMKIALASDSCCFCGKHIIEKGENDAPNAA